jgi:hypothetical protein
MSELEKKCLSLSKEEKERLINVLMESLEFNVTGKTLKEIHDAVVKVFGKEVLTGKRNRVDYIGRVIFSYECFLEGYSETCIGNYINRNHSCVNMMKKTMRGWLQMPRLYKEENDLYVKVKNVLNHETDR